VRPGGPGIKGHWGVDGGNGRPLLGLATAVATVGLRWVGRSRRPARRGSNADRVDSCVLPMRSRMLAALSNLGMGSREVVAVREKRGSMNEVTSRHIRNSAELLVRAPIRQDMVPIVDTMSYATRLRTLLCALYDARRMEAEAELSYGTGPIEQLQTLLNSQWTVTDDDRWLLVTVSFDRSWEEYFSILVRKAGPALDLIFQHCEDYADYSCVAGDGGLRYQGFAEWVRRHQIETNFYYSTAPDVTVDDIAYMRRLSGSIRPGLANAAKIHVGTPAQEARKYPCASDERGAKNHYSRTLRRLAALDLLRPYFPEQIEGIRNTSEKPLLFDLAVRNLLPEIELLPVGLAPSEKLKARVKQLRKLLPTPARPDQPVKLDEDALESIQGNIITSYPRTSHGCLVLLRFDTAEQGRAFVGSQADLVTTEKSAGETRVYRNLAITYSGLERLGLDATLLASLPHEFRFGMAARSGALGDLGDAHPSRWQLPRANWPHVDDIDASSATVNLAAVDFVMTLQTRSDSTCHCWKDGHPLAGEVADLARDGVHILHVQILQRAPNPEPPDDATEADKQRLREQVREHFGFVDGLSQPTANAVAGGGAAPPGIARDRVPLGEFLLGYPDARGEIRAAGDPKRSGQEASGFFQNGSYLVVRKLEQDVAGYRKWAHERSKELGLSPDGVGALIVGRERDGAPLVPHTFPNDFDYGRDGDGSQCPLHSHVRRANPRNGGAEPIPRIARRGFSYGARLPESAVHDGGSDAGSQLQVDGERGLMFMAFNASIAQQFEVIQRWLNGGNSTGLHSAQNDLLSGSPICPQGPHWVKVERGRQKVWRHLTPPEKPLTLLRWGLYAFVPSIRAMQQLADQLPQDPRLQRLAALVPHGEEIIGRLKDLERTAGEAAARAGWQTVIEEPQRREQALAVWAAVRVRRGLLDTPYGVLVGSREGAEQVLSGTGRDFSVREYWHRLCQTTGEHYIAFDPDPGTLQVADSDAQRNHRAYEQRLRSVAYAESAAPANEYIEKHFDAASALTQAAAIAREAAEAILDRAGPHGGIIDLKDFASETVAVVSKRWFGVPGSASEPEELRGGILPIVLASRFGFQPWPTRVLAEQATAAQTTPTAPATDTDFYRYLLGAFGARTDRNQLARDVVVGSSVGFSAPALASVVTVLAAWFANGQLWSRAEEWLQESSAERAWSRLFGNVLETLGLAPVPSLLYRTAMPGARIGETSIEAGRVVVVGLGAAALDPDQELDSLSDFGATDWLFGGPRSVNPHACPARRSAVGVVAGTVSAVLERDNPQLGPGLTLCYGPRRHPVDNLESR